MVYLPIKGDTQILQLLEHNVVKRFRSSLRKFVNDPIFHQQYLEFMKKYENIGHIKLILEDSDAQTIYLFMGLQERRGRRRNLE